MEMNEFAKQAVNAALKTRKAYCKFLSVTDMEEINSNRKRIPISNTAIYLFFSVQEPRKKGILRKSGTVKWQNSMVTDCTFVYDARKKELWIAEIGDDFPFNDQDYTGALLVLIKTESYYQGFVFNTDDSIQEFLGVFGMSPSETGGVLKFTIPVQNNSNCIE